MESIMKLSDAELRSELIAYGATSAPVVNKFTRPVLQKKLAKLIEASGGRQHEMQEDETMEIDQSSDEEPIEDEPVDESIDESIDEQDFTQVQEQNLHLTHTPIATTKVNTATSPGIPRTPHLDTSAEVLRRRQLRSTNLTTRSTARRPQKEEVIVQKRSIGWKSIIAFLILIVGCAVIYMNMEDSHVSLKM